MIIYVFVKCIVSDIIISLCYSIYIYNKELVLYAEMYILKKNV